MADLHVDTTWRYETAMQSHVDYVTGNIVQLLHALLMLAVLVVAELCFGFFV